MSPFELYRTAGKLAPPSMVAAQEYAERAAECAASVTHRLSARPDLERLIGPDNQAMMEDNHRNHARFMESIFLHYDPATLVETVLWVYRAYLAHGFQLTYWPAQLNTWVDVLREHLSPEAFTEIYPFYHWFLIHQADFVRLAGSTHLPEPPHEFT